MHWEHPNLCTDQSWDRGFVKYITGLQRKEGNGNYALHWHTEAVEWLGHPLAAPLIV